LEDPFFLGLPWLSRCVKSRHLRIHRTLRLRSATSAATLPVACASRRARCRPHGSRGRSAVAPLPSSSWSTVAVVLMELADPRGRVTGELADPRGWVAGELWTTPQRRPRPWLSAIPALARGSTRRTRQSLPPISTSLPDKVSPVSLNSMLRSTPTSTQTRSVPPNFQHVCAVSLEMEKARYLQRREHPLVGRDGEVAAPAATRAYTGGTCSVSALVFD
jgi:hypothetical protein